jgi:putative Mg2+ transporter-C (MgtC) family protein
VALDDFILRIALAVLSGFVIGLERQLTGNMVGIRINVLVCFGACCFVLFPMMMNAPDISRVAAQIVTGVGFLCSGIIFRDGSNVRGLNTAATIWCSAAIGVLCSMGSLAYTAIATTALLVTNAITRVVSSYVHPLELFNAGQSTYKLTIICDLPGEEAIRTALMRELAHTQLRLNSLTSSLSLDNMVEISATIISYGRKNDSLIRLVAEKINAADYTVKTSWELS